jgi:hypothetical protein
VLNALLVLNILPPLSSGGNGSHLLEASFQ